MRMVDKWGVVLISPVGTTGARHRSRRHSSAIRDGTLRLFRRISNRRSFWSADGVGACETVCPFSDNSFAWETKPVSTNPRAQLDDVALKIRARSQYCRAALRPNITMEDQRFSRKSGFWTQLGYQARTAFCGQLQPQLLASTDGKMAAVEDG